MGMRRILASAIILHAGLLSAQYNDKGSIHLAIGGGFGAFATEYDQTITILGFPIRTTSDGGAATTTVPIEFHYGFAKVFSLGFYVEPGNYIDSVETKENKIMLIGLQPRFYLVNKDRFAWMAGLQLGSTRLSMDDPEAAGAPKTEFRGAHFGLSTGVGFLVTDLIGIQLHVRYLANTLLLTDYEVSGSAVSLDLVDAELRARGIGLQASLNFRF
jgi:hypothetical protein